MEINEITQIIIGCGIEVHKQLGPGLLESTYQTCLYFELEKSGLSVQQQVGFPLLYKAIQMNIGYNKK